MEIKDNIQFTNVAEILIQILYKKMN